MSNDRAGGNAMKYSRPLVRPAKLYLSIHLRTSSVESPFATVRLRQRVTKGAGSRTKGLLMAYKLLDMARARGVASMARTCCRSSEKASPSWTECSKGPRA